MPYRNLASYKRFDTHLTTNWPTFCAKRSEHLRQQGLNPSQAAAQNEIPSLNFAFHDHGLHRFQAQKSQASLHRVCTSPAATRQ